jgi:hypothetical protein
VNKNDSVILEISSSSAFTTLDFVYFMLHLLRCWYDGLSVHV